MSAPPRPPRPVMVRLPALALGACIALTVLLGVAWMVIDPNAEGMARATGVPALLAVLCAAWLVAALVVRARRLEISMALGFIGAFFGVGLLVLLLCVGPHMDWATQERTSKIAATLLVSSLALIHNGGISLLRVRGVVIFIKVITMTCPWFLAGGVVTVAWLDELILGARLGFVIVIPSMIGGFIGTIVGTVVVAIVAFSRVDRTVAPVESIEARSRLDMACPFCGFWQSLPRGAARCGRCRVRLFIEVEEPRCACGYLLYRLQNPTCPECGREVDPALVWSEREEAGDR